MNRQWWAWKAVALATATPCTLSTSAQKGEDAGSEGRHLIALFTGNSWIPEGLSHETGDKETVIAPTFGLDYEFRLSDDWSLGTYNDVEIMNILVEEEDGTLLERENTVVLTVGGSLRLNRRMKVELSGGVESDAHETLRVARIAYEYGFELPQNWELGIAASYILKDFYNVFGLGLVIGHRFGR